MTSIAGIHTTKPRTQRYVEAFVSGTPGPFKIYQWRDLKNLPAETLIMYGILAGSGEVYKWCKKENKDFYFMDHGYFSNAHDHPHWLRITKNAHCQTKLIERPADRYEKYFKKDIKKWNKNGAKILILPPTNAIANFFNAEDWLDNTLKILRKNTDRELVVREKPYNPGVGKDHVGATIKVDIQSNKTPGKINWSEYFACVTYNSNTIIESFVNGVPVFCDSKNCAATPIAETDFSKIEKPIYEDRVSLFSSLAYNNFSMEEMINETAWKLLSDIA
tara:strand:- start:382 stop:1209 length:828 start_codon:yes stop_codon:yes gene_type:complete